MSNPKEGLNPTQIREAKLKDFRFVHGWLRARFSTGTFVRGVEFVNGIAALAEESNHHPDITLTYTDVVVAMRSHDVGAITSRDINLARQISDLAGAMGLDVDVKGLTAVDMGLDVPDASEGDAAARLAPFYAALLGSEVQGRELTDATHQTPSLWWQVTEDDGNPSLPKQDPPQKWHFDVWVAEGEGQARVDAALAAGGRLVSDEAAPSYWVLEDADGNRSCVCTSAARG